MELVGAQTTNQMQTESPCLNAAPLGALNNLATAPVFGTVTPNRIFVGGIDVKTKENDLRMFFTQYGTVKEVKIVSDRAGVSKGYGFITFETQEDAQKILQEVTKLDYKDKRLNIGPAVRKQQMRSPRSTGVTETGAMYLTTSSGYPYVYHNGMAYFHTSEVASVPQAWPSCSPPSSPVMVAQPVYQSPTYHYQVLTQCLPSQLQWSVPQSPASSPSLVCLQPSEVIYQPVGVPQDNGYIFPPLLVETAAPELFPDHGVQAPHHQPYVQSAMAVPVPESRSHALRRDSFHHSSVSLKPQCR